MVWDSLVWILGLGFPGLGFLVLESWLGFLDLDSWVWIPGYGVLGLDSWAWIPGFGALGLESWAWIPGFGLLAGTLMNTISKYIRFEPKLQILWSPPTIECRVPRKLGLETPFKSEAHHELARALQLTLTW